MQLHRSTVADATFPSVIALFVQDRLSRTSRASMADRGLGGEILGMDWEQFRLSLRVSELEQELVQARRSNLSKFVTIVGKIVEVSHRIFPGTVTFDYAFDPEDATNEYIVVDVVAEGGFADYKDRVFQWHDEVEKLIPGMLSEFRLIVHPKS